MSKDCLYIGSQSKHRQLLLQQSEINYRVLEHKSDECSVDLNHDLHEYVLDIAKDKMKHLVWPNKTCVVQDYMFVLTVDTMVIAMESKKAFGKPKGLDDAKRMLSLLCKEKADVVTGCCLEKRIYKDGAWIIVDKKYWTTSTIVEFCVDKDQQDLFFEKAPGALHTAGGVMIEHEFGQQFCKSINGSYTSIIGLPLFELRVNLKEMGFLF